MAKKDPDTLLLRGLERKSYRAMRSLIDKGANPDARNQAGDTALILAARRSDVNAITLLLAYGADVRLKGASGVTAYVEAAGTNKAQIQDKLRQEIKKMADSH